MPIIISGIEHLEQGQRERVHDKLLDIIVETFVDPADSDFISARFMALNHQKRPFFWPALQAIEKYLKALLLSHGVSVRGKRFGHKIVAMSERLDGYDDVLKNLRLTPVPEHEELRRLDLWGSEDPFEFIREIEKYGLASNRYNFWGANFEASCLPKLDQLVFALRSRCVGTRALKGVGRNEKLDYYAYEQNYPFAPSSYNQGEFWGKFVVGQEVPSIEAALKGLYGHPAVFQRWLTDNIDLSEDEVAKIAGR